MLEKKRRRQKLFKRRDNTALGRVIRLTLSGGGARAANGWVHARLTNPHMLSDARRQRQCSSEVREGKGCVSWQQLGNVLVCPHPRMVPHLAAHKTCMLHAQKQRGHDGWAADCRWGRREFIQSANVLSLAPLLVYDPLIVYRAARELELYAPSTSMARISVLLNGLPASSGTGPPCQSAGYASRAHRRVGLAGFGSFFPPPRHVDPPSRLSAYSHVWAFRLMARADGWNLPPRIAGAQMSG